MVQMIRILTLSILFACAGAYAMQSPSPKGCGGKAGHPELSKDAGLDVVPGPVDGGSKPDLGKQFIALIQNGNEGLVARQIARGVDVNATDRYGSTALMAAIIYDREDICNMLIDANADVNKVDGRGQTALEWAALNSSLDICKRLINAGADVNHINKITRFHDCRGNPDGYKLAPLARAVMAVKPGTDRQLICELLVEKMLSSDKAQKQSMLALMISLKSKKLIIPGAYIPDVRRLLCKSLSGAIREENAPRVLAVIKELPAWKDYHRERINNLLKKYFPHESILE